MSLPNVFTPSPTFDPSIVAAGGSIGISDSFALPRNEGGPRHAEALQFDVEAPEYDLGRELERVVDLLATRADAKGIELASFVDPEVPARLYGSGQRFQQVAANLLGHAVQAIERGGVLARISLGRETSADATVLVSIWYTGQTDGAASESPGHAFPALRRLVELLGGDLGWGAGAGGGSILWFTARFTKPPSSPPPESPRPASIEQSTGQQGIKSRTIEAQASSTRTTAPSQEGRQLAGSPGDGLAPLSGTAAGISPSHAGHERPQRVVPSA